MPCPTPFGTSELIYSHLTVTENCAGYIGRDLICIVLFFFGSLSIWCQWWHDEESETPVGRQIFYYICFVLCIPVFEFAIAFLVVFFACYACYEIKVYVNLQDVKEKERSKQSAQSARNDPEAVEPLIRDSVPVRTIVDSTRITSYDIDNPVTGRPSQNQP